MKGFQPKRFKTQNSKLENILQKFLFPRWSRHSTRLSNLTGPSHGILFSLQGLTMPNLSILTILPQKRLSFQLFPIYHP